MRRHWALELLRTAEEMVARDDALELLAFLVRGEPPHIRARRRRERQARGLPTAPPLPSSGLSERDDDGSVSRLLA